MEINRIKAVNIKTLTVEDGKKVKKISDGGGLYLFVYPTVKQWYFLQQDLQYLTMYVLTVYFDTFWN